MSDLSTPNPQLSTVLIGGDICPIEGNRSYFEKGDAGSIFNDLLVEFEQVDLAIGNLECPLIERQMPMLKTGPNFGEPLACINGFKQAGIDVLCLANNHVLDHGPDGLKSTLDACERAGIATVGAGQNLAAARRILVKVLKGVRVGILAVAEQEFSIARRDSWGANPIDLVDFVRNVRDHRPEFDYLIVLLHGADEFHVPTPRTKDTCHFMIEMGANTVIVQHPHVLGGYEEYRGGHIVYGQGALVMDEAIYRDLSSFHEGFLVKLVIQKDASSRLEIIPFTQSAPLPGARRMDKVQEREFHRKLEAKSTAVKDDSFVEAEWLRFCDAHRHGYLSALLGHNRVLTKLNSGGLLERTLHRRKQLLRAKNIACCETHREAIETIFNHGLI